LYLHKQHPSSVQARHTLINTRILSHPIPPEGGIIFAAWLFAWLDAEGQAAYTHLCMDVYPFPSQNGVL